MALLDTLQYNTMRSGSQLTNHYINIDKKGASELSGDTVDPKLHKAEPLIWYREHMERMISRTAFTNQLSGGAIKGERLEFDLLYSDISTYLLNQFHLGKLVTEIEIFHGILISGGLKAGIEKKYEKCVVTDVCTPPKPMPGENMEDFHHLNIIRFGCHWLKMTCTVTKYKSNGEEAGKLVSQIDLEKGQLGATAAPAAEGGGEAAAAPAATGTVGSTVA